MKEVVLNKYPIRLEGVPEKAIVTPDDEIDLHFIAVAIAKRQSGKTVAIASKIKDLKSQGFADRVLLISPTYDSPVNAGLFKDIVAEEDRFHPTYDAVDKVKEIVKEEGDAWESYKEELKLWKKWQQYKSKSHLTQEVPDDLAMYAYTQNLWEHDDVPPPKSKYGHYPRLIAFFDDVQSSRLFTPSTKNPFHNFVISHRHQGKVGISLFIAVQNYTAAGGLPRSIRENMTHAMIWYPSDVDRRKQIAKELSAEIPQEVLLQALETCNEKYRFLTVDLNPKKPEYRFRRNWDVLLIPEGQPDIADDKQPKISNNKVNLEDDNNNRTRGSPRIHDAGKS